MSAQTTRTIIEQLILEIEKLIPHYMEDPLDQRISNGNVAICIMEQNGMVHGKIYGDNQIRGRQSYRVAWTKASQVWITGIKTMEFEKLFFTNAIDGKKFGIEAPDLIGWEGGQPLTLKDGTVLSIGFSGFRGVIDIEIVVKALAVVEGM
jgi:uncharacterized protein GlcG (DUF336 family)